MENQLDFEKSDLNGLIRKLNRKICTLGLKLPRRAWESIDNLQRAAKSVGRNYAEACGRWHLADKIHRNQIARGSTYEVVASLNELVDYEYVTELEIHEARHLALEIAGSLTGLIRHFVTKEKPRS